MSRTLKRVWKWLYALPKPKKNAQGWYWDTEEYRLWRASRLAGKLEKSRQGHSRGIGGWGRLDDQAVVDYKVSRRLPADEKQQREGGNSD